jgi:hypothetical protein
VSTICPCWRQVAFLFTTVNLENALKSAEQLSAEGIAPQPASAELDEPDDDEDELNYVEWCDVIVRAVKDKFAARITREGSDFHEVLNGYLEGEMIPRFLQIIKDKKRGIGSKHL